MYTYHYLKIKSSDRFQRFNHLIYHFLHKVFYQAWCQSPIATLFENVNCAASVTYIFPYNFSSQISYFEHRRRMINAYFPPIFYTWWGKDNDDGDVQSGRPQFHLYFRIQRHSFSCCIIRCGVNEIAPCLPPTPN